MPDTSPALMIAAILPLIVGIVLLVLRQRMARQLKEMEARLQSEIDARKKVSTLLMDQQVASSRAAQRVGMAHEAAEKLIGERDAIREQLQALHVKTERMTAELTWARNAVADAGAERHDLSQKLSKATQAATAAQDNIARGSESISQAQQEAELLRKQVADLQKQGAQHQKQAADLQKQTDVLERQVTALRTELATEKLEADKGTEAVQTVIELELEAKEARNALDATATEVRALNAELRAAKEREKALEQELANAPKQAPTDDGVVSALEADTYLNRGQRETLRMMYEKFTSKVAKR
jgi:chemotaxis protein MotB